MGLPASHIMLLYKNLMSYCVGRWKNYSKKREYIKPAFNVHLLYGRHCPGHCSYIIHDHGAHRVLRLWLTGSVAVGCGLSSHVCLCFSTLSISEMGAKSGTVFRTAVTMSDSVSAWILSHCPMRWPTPSLLQIVRKPTPTILLPAKIWFYSF